ncbi:MAG: flagellar biosynthesis protein FlhF [Planctomycetes bacterium]|nr:flagellar biosynthesis protein FlhF [Planctomycetota bacterium]
MHQALAQIKREIGPDAAIVRTRTFKRGGVFGLGARTVVEVTARPSQKADTRRSSVGNNRLQQAYNATANLSQTNNRSAAISQEAFSGAATAIATAPVNDEFKDQLNDLRSLVEDLVKEQRQLHAPQMPEQLFDLYLDLIQKEVADEMARELIGHAQKELTGNQAQNTHLIRQRLVQIMDTMIDTSGPIARNLDGSARVVALVGPTGVGKTTTIAKLAADFKLRQNKNVGLITIDTYRIGAVDQLRMYADIIDVPLKVVLTPAELKEAVALMGDLDIILIDTAGRSQNDQIKIRELQTFLTAAAPHEIHLVLASTAHHSHMLSAAENFKVLGVDRVIFTKLDEAISFGVLLSVMKKMEASLSYITIGQDVPDDIEVGNSSRLARLLLGLESIRETSETAINTVVS